MGRGGRKSLMGILGWGLGRGWADRRVRVVGGAGQGEATQLRHPRRRRARLVHHQCGLTGAARRHVPGFSFLLPDLLPRWRAQGAAGGCCTCAMGWSRAEKSSS